jgi:hypothetical protein
MAKNMTNQGAIRRGLSEGSNRLIGRHLDSISI